MTHNTLKLDSERRDEPRYPVTNVEALIHNENFNAQCVVLDLSLNGALLLTEENLERDPGEAVSIRVEIPNQRCFEASARIVHCTQRRIGMEFLAFDPADFDVLSEMIADLRRSRVANLLSPNRD